GRPGANRERKFGHLRVVHSPARSFAESSPLGRALRGGELRHLEEGGEEGDAQKRWLTTDATPDRHEPGKKQGAVVVSRDVTTEKAVELELYHLSIRDALTDLHNRRGFQALAEQQLKMAHRARTSPALLFIDLDEMKPINDLFGHEAGDRALRDT